ncbi:hypothetical protein ACQP00_39530 [Dactylosporangium sp. CS-047395]|uniref:hypothetical protein n=1 Tax=Dactylosporangium sp. CS-047395 TaxID=3239936 RepID=UPI003D93212D
MRRRLRGLRIYLAVIAGALTTVISTVYENVPPSLRYGSLIVVALLSGVVLLLTDTGSARSPGGRDSSGDWPTTARSGVEARQALAEPIAQTAFVGRESELDELTRWHDEQRAERTPGRSRPAAGLGCVQLFLHGGPGVGKSAIARKLAERLAPRYRHGVHIVDLGTAGAPRPPGEVLTELLLALGWPESDVPADPQGRAIAFRSLAAGKSLLFVFDAARTADQVELIMPTHPQNAVIVTSRFDLSLVPDMQAARSFLVDVPSESDALHIFRAMSRTEDRDSPYCAAEIVEGCGRLPVAIRSAAERISDDATNVCAVASYLREPTTRLSRLAQPGRQVQEVLQSEFDRLLPMERQALTYLAFLPSPTFAPWILMPLLDVNLREAEALADRLHAAQLVRAVGAARRTHVVRFTVPPLVGLFASQVAADVPADRRRAATRRADRAYRALTARVLNRITPGAGLAEPADPYVDGLLLADRIARDVPGWIDAEYRTILHQIGVAARAGDDEACWRLGALLGGATPATLDYESTANAYRLATAAAERIGPGPLTATQFAKGRFLAAAGRYGEAEIAFDLALEAGKRAGTPQEQAEHAIVKQLLLGQALVRMGAHDLADERLTDCLRRATDARAATHVYNAEILVAINSHVECPYWVQDRLQDDTLDDLGRFSASIAYAESALRGREWSTALHHLRAARSSHDLSRAAFVAVRTAEVHLEHARHLERTARPQGIADALDRAIEAACGAIWRYHQLRDNAGEHRAKWVLARAFGAAGQLGMAEQLAQGLKTEVTDTHKDPDSPGRAMVARVHQLNGELLYRFGDAPAARAVLIQAATLFQILGDPMSEDDVRETIQRPPSAATTA